MARLDNLDYEVNGTITNYEIVPEIAPLFNATTAYAAGDTVIEEGHLYRFNTAHAAGAWIGTDADEITVGEELTSHGADITELKADLTSIETDIESGDLTAGTAKQLLSDTGMTDKSPYLFRAMPTGAGDREEPVIVGGSVVWNQLCNPSGGESSEANGITKTKNDDGSFTFNGTSTAYFAHAMLGLGKTVFNHVVLAKFNQNTPQSGVSGMIQCHGSGAEKRVSSTVSDYVMCKCIPTNSTGYKISVYFDSATTVENITVKPVAFDLTATFGTTIADYVYSLESATAGAGVAWLKKYGFFTKDYYPYTEPTFKHVEGLVAHKMVGFNQWDEDAEVGGINTANGQAQVDYQRIRSKNFIPCLPGTTYYTNLGFNRFQYDENQNFISFAWQAQGTFTTASNCHYLKFCTATNYGTTYNHDICINLHWDGERDGEYEAYKEYTYPLDDSLTLRGIPKLDANNNLYFDGDVYRADGTVSRRYIEVLVDGGVNGIAFSGAWGAEANGYTVYISTGLGARSYNTISDRFIVSNASIATMPLMSFVGNSGSSSTWSFVLPSTVTSLAEANTWASNNPFHIIIPRSTPTTETADPYAPLQLADPYGTEEWVLDDEAFPMPVGQETFYPENLRAKIEGLPWNFANLIAPTEVSNVATRAYTAGQLFIVNNILYKATTSIASGGTITPGTNCTATTLAEVISAL